MINFRSFCPPFVGKIIVTALVFITLLTGVVQAQDTSKEAITLENAAQVVELAVLEGHTGTVYGVAFSPDGTILATAGADGTVRLWDVATGEETAVLEGHTGEVNKVAFSPDGITLASASSDETIRLWDVETGEETAVLEGHHSMVAGVAFSPDGKLLASSSVDNVRLWDPAAGTMLDPVVWPTGRDEIQGVIDLTFSPDGKFLALASVRDFVVLLDVETREELQRIASSNPGFPYSWSSVAFSRDGERIAAGCGIFSAWQLDSVHVWDIETGENVFFLTQLPEEDVPDIGKSWTVAFNQDSTLLASGNNKSSVILLDAATGLQVMNLEGHSDMVNGLAFSPDGSLLASASIDGTVRLWGINAD